MLVEILSNAAQLYEKKQKTRERFAVGNGIEDDSRSSELRINRIR